MEALPREHLIESLIGIKSSRQTYYSVYREQERRLDRAITAIADISAALCNTTDGVPALVRAVVQVAAQHFDAQWAIITLTTETVQRWVACRDAEGTVVLEACWIPHLFDQIICEVLEQQQLVILHNDGLPITLGAPMCLHDQVIGVLAVAPAPGFPLDEREISVLRTLANHAAVAFKNARLYEESERLRAQATALYEEAYRQKTEVEEKNRQLQRARRWLAMARQNEIVNNERTRIARELHDSVAQHLIGIGMHLEWCRAQLSEHAVVYERICTAKELARNAITRMRAAIFELSTIHGSQSGLATMLRELAQDFEKTTHLHISIQVDAQPLPMPVEFEHAVYHIVQEALFNVYKHAQAQHVTITLRYKSDALTIVVADDGVGIPKKQLDQSLHAVTEQGTAHFGLHNMRERALEIGGKLTISRRRRGGTTVCVTVPLRSLEERTTNERSDTVDHYRRS